MKKKKFKIIIPLILLIIILFTLLLIKNIYEKIRNEQKIIYNVEDRTNNIKDNQFDLSQVIIDGDIIHWYLY